MDDYRDYLCSYPFGRDGAQYCIIIKARSAEEAHDRLKAIGGWGVVDGELVARIKARPGAGVLVRLLVALRNIAPKRA